MAGFVAEALAEARTAVQQAIRYQETSNCAWALNAMGDAHLASGSAGASDAVEAYQKCEAIAEEQGLLPLLAKCRFGLGEAYGALGQPEIATRALASARRIRDSIGLQIAP